MLRITRHADYGIVMLTQLAQDQGHGDVNARTLAARTNLPPPMVSKILKMLTRAGILSSHRGAGGGYRLARTVDEISVAEIITALDGPIALTQCIENSPGECEVENWCQVRGKWEKINTVIREALEAISLAEMARPLPVSIGSVEAGKCGCPVGLVDAGKCPPEQETPWRE